MPDRVEVQGLARFRATLALARARIAHPTDPLDEAGRLIEQRGRSRAPVRTGRLAASLSSSTNDTEATIGSSIAYAAVTEYGGGNNIPAQPYLRPALDYSAVVVLRLFEDHAQQALHGVKGI